MTGYITTFHQISSRRRVPTPSGSGDRILLHRMSIENVLRKLLSHRMATDGGAVVSALRVFNAMAAVHAIASAAVLVVEAW